MRSLNLLVLALLSTFALAGCCGDDVAPEPTVDMAVHHDIGVHPVDLGCSNGDGGATDDGGAPHCP
jgi:hypothetical protein